MDFLVGIFYFFYFPFVLAESRHEGFDPFVLFSHSFIRLFLSGGGKKGARIRPQTRRATKLNCVAFFLKSSYFYRSSFHSFMAFRPGDGGKGSERKAAFPPSPGPLAPFLAAYDWLENACGIFYILPFSSSR